jgi:hypothetical protein
MSTRNPPVGLGSSGSGEHEQRPADLARVDPPLRVDPPRVEPAVVPELDDPPRSSRSRAHRVLPGDRRRARLLQKQVLPGRQHRACVLGVVDRPCGDDHRVDVAGREQLGVAASPHPELLCDLGRLLTPRRRYGDELRSRELRAVPRMHGAHPAEAGDAQSDP